MSLSLIPARPEHVPELARICHVAFSALHDRHNVPRDIPSVDVAQMIIGSIVARPDYHGIAAMLDDKLVGSNFFCTGDEVAGVGPITVNPACQARGVGRALMQWAIDESKRCGVREMRLYQEAVNTTSLPLYASLGFRWRDAAALMKIKPATADDPTIRPITPEDLPAVATLSQKHYGFSRANDAKMLLQMPLPGFVRTRGGEIVGYQIASLFGHAAGETIDDLLALLAHAGRHVPEFLAIFLCPLSEQELFARALSSGHRVAKVLNYMSLETFTAPRGNWLPSIQC